MKSQLLTAVRAARGGHPVQTGAGDVFIDRGATIKRAAAIAYVAQHMYKIYGVDHGPRVLWVAPWKQYWQILDHEPADMIGQCVRLDAR